MWTSDLPFQTVVYKLNLAKLIFMNYSDRYTKSKNICIYRPEHIENWNWCFINKCINVDELDIRSPRISD